MIQMCFSDADRAWHSTDPSKKITRERYLEALLAHLRGMRHPEDIAPNRHKNLVCTWVQAFQKVALKDNYEPLSDTSEWEKVFNACMDNDFASFQTSIEKFDHTKPPSPLQPAAILAAEHGGHDILRHCLQLGARMDSGLTHRSMHSVRSFEMMEVLYEYDWNGIRSSTEKAQGWVGWFGERSLQAVWLKKYAIPGGESVRLDDHDGPDVRSNTIARAIQMTDHLW